MTAAFIGYTLDIIGKLLIAWVTLRIHVKHFKSHHVEQRDLRLDVWLSSTGIAMIAIGYLLRAPFEYGQG